MRAFLHRRRFTVAAVLTTIVTISIIGPFLGGWIVVWYGFCVGVGYLAACADRAEQSRERRRR